MYYVIYIELIILVTISMYTDIKTYKIKNNLVITFTLIGLVTNLLLYGFSGITASLIGLFLPMVLFFVLFALKMMGAGDIKLFCAIGAVAGYKLLLEDIAVSIIVGGIISLYIMVRHKLFLVRVKYFFNYIKSAIYFRKLSEYASLHEKDNSKFKFGVAVCVATYLLIIFKILSGGMSVWQGITFLSATQILAI